MLQSSAAGKGRFASPGLRRLRRLVSGFPPVSQAYTRRGSETTEYQRSSPAVSAIGPYGTGRIAGRSTAVCASGPYGSRSGSRSTAGRGGRSSFSSGRGGGGRSRDRGRDDASSGGRSPRFHDSGGYDDQNSGRGRGAYGGSPSKPSGAWSESASQDSNMQFPEGNAASESLSPGFSTSNQNFNPRNTRPQSGRISGTTFQPREGGFRRDNRRDGEQDRDQPYRRYRDGKGSGDRSDSARSGGRGRGNRCVPGSAACSRFLRAF